MVISNKIGVILVLPGFETILKDLSFGPFEKSLDNFVVEFFANKQTFSKLAYF